MSRIFLRNSIEPAALIPFSIDQPPPMARMIFPVPPQFSRAMRVGENLVLISGTASIVGYESHHALDLAAQLNESLANLESVLARAGATAPRVHGRIGSKGLLKVYLRDAAAAAIVEAQLNKRRPSMPHLLLAGDICRRDLLVEVECVQGGS